MKSKLFVFLFLGCLLAGFSAPIKVKVTVDNASLKAMPEIQAKTVARIPLNTVLDSEEKQGEWYKVTLDREGVKMTGYIHEYLVTVVSGEGEAAGGGTVAGEKPQAEIMAEISLKIEDCRNLIRRDNKFEEAMNQLSPLVAKTFKVTDPKRQKELATDIFLLKGMALAGRGDELAARKEFRNVFEISPALAKDAQKNIFDPKVLVLFQQAEREYLGFNVEFSMASRASRRARKSRSTEKRSASRPKSIRARIQEWSWRSRKKPIKRSARSSNSPRTSRKKITSWSWPAPSSHSIPSRKGPRFSWTERTRARRQAAN